MDRGYRLDSTKSEIGLGIARLYYETGHLSEAEQWLKKQVSLDSTQFDFSLLLAELYYAQQREDEAIAIFEKLHEQQLLQASRFLLSHYQSTNDLSATFNYADEILLFDSLNTNALNHKAWVFDRRGYYASALQYYEKSLAIDSLNQEASIGVEKVEGKIAYLRKLKERRDSAPRLEFTVPKRKKILINE